jgi:hypothetical protein
MRSFDYEKSTENGAPDAFIQITILGNQNISSDIGALLKKSLKLKMDMLKRCLMVFTLLSGIAAQAQDNQMKTLPLTDMSAFKPQAGNWQIVGDVAMDRTVDIHALEKKPVETGTDSKKKKKSKENEVAPVLPKAVTFQTGTGILLNMNDDVKKDNLLSLLEHGDIELELEVMLPKGSNSGIYMQGRYEVQLYDSWGVRNPKFSDIGGIYRNWEREAGKIYMGKAPLSNPAKAPGLWQSLKIVFKAPRFDTSGNKISNARFVSVDLNGVRIHDNVEVPLPTGGPVENNEKPFGPLLIQGDHGPVAFRNIRYKLMKDLKVTLGEITYKTYRGSFKSFEELATTKPVKTGTSNELSVDVVDDENEYGAVFTGTLTVPEDNTYEFRLRFSGGAKLVVDGQALVDLPRPDAWANVNKEITLKAGTYPFEIYNFKRASWLPPRIGLYAKTASSYPNMLSAYNSFPPDDDPTSPIMIEPGNSPRLLRAFIDFKNDRRKRLTHTIGVGEPSGIHYVYDLASGNLACVWRGNFVDATPMWHDRGDGSFKPLGAVQYLFVNQPLAFLSSPNEAFPNTPNENDFRSKGYVIDETTGRPVFRYTYQGLEVEDKISPDDGNRILRHEVSIKNRGSKTGLYYKLAEGSDIVSMPDGSFAVDGKQYYIKSVSPVTIRDVDGKKELISSVDGSTVNYSIIW